MDFHLYNTLSRKKDKFVPINPKKVRMYVCGPTVYSRIHIGNARSAIVYDLLYRILINIYGAKNTVYVQNITDIDDKIIDAVQNTNLKISDFTQKNIDYFIKDSSYLSILEPNHRPKATDHIKEIIHMIQRLIDTDFAYVENGSVYFDVSKIKFYSELSNIKRENIHDTNEKINVKKSRQDFVLWKKGKNTEKREYLFQSPWSIGRPGWHIECSAMSTKILGKNFDIHGGGVDLVFPHHTNEIAQSKSAFPDSLYSKFWIHNGFLRIDNQKMSKSLQNVLNVHDLEKKNIRGEEFRLFIFNTHYRKPINFCDNSIQEARKKLHQIVLAAKKINYQGRIITKKQIENYKLAKDFKKFLFDDMNSHLAINFLYHKANQILNGREIHSNSKEMISGGEFLGILSKSLFKKTSVKISQEEKLYIEKLIQERNTAKKNKNWQLADEIRKKINKRGLIVIDNKDGSTSLKS